MVGEHRSDYASEWAALTLIAGKIGCTKKTLRRWCREEASPNRSWLSAPAAQSSDAKARLKLLEREGKELCRANEILHKVSAYFALGNISTAATNCEGLHRSSSQGHGYRADLPRTGTRNSLAPHRPGMNMLPALLMSASGQRVPGAMTR